MKLSIIIYLHNTEKEKLERCLNSANLLSIKDKEIIVIDDGSCENYGDVLEKCHPVYVKTQYRGAFASKLYALTIANGEYIAFLDSRDTVSFNYYASMVSEAEKSGADAVINDYALKKGEMYSYCRTDFVLSEDLCVSGSQLLKRASSLPSCYMLGNKVFKKETLAQAKHEIEKSNVIMKKCNGISDSIISFFALENAKCVKNIHTGYAFFEIAEENSLASLPSEESSQLAEFKNSAYISNVGLWAEKATAVYAPNGAANAQGLCADGFLGKNLEVVDAVARWIHKKGGDVSVFYSENDGYACKIMGELERGFGIKVANEKNAQLSIPERKAGFFDKLLHKKYVRNVDVALLLR